MWRPDRYLSAALSCLLTVGSFVGLAGAASAGNAKAEPSAFTAALSLSPKSSMAGQRVTASLGRSTLPTGDKAKKITLSWGDQTNTMTLPGLKAKPSHRYARPGRYTARLVITDEHKKTVHTTASEVVTPARPVPGSYAATNPQNNAPITFFVSSDGTKLQDIWISSVSLNCTPGGSNITDHVSIASIALNPDGSFSASPTQDGVHAGSPTSFAYTFRGNYMGLNSAGIATVTGSFRETMSFTDSAARTCTSNDLSWTGARDTQPAQTASAPPAGSYAAINPQNNAPITFFVSSDGTKLQDISISSLSLNCTPGGSNITDHVSIASIALNPDGSFSASPTQNGVYAGNPTSFAYTFRGNVHSLNPAGAERLAGTFRETMSFTDSAARTCTSNDLSWTGARDTQPAQTASAPPAGSYAAINPQNNAPITFFVSSDGTKLQDISISSLSLNCTPGGSNITDHVSIASIALNPDGSFSASPTQNGVYAGNPTSFAYTFRGNVHSLNPAGAERLAGTFRETMSFTDSAARTCTSNDLSWTGARDTQPAQTASAPPAGSYAAINPQNNAPITFSVAAGGGTLQNISITSVSLNCAPGGSNVTDHVSIASITLNPDGSFTGNVTQNGVHAGNPATFTYNFQGNFHAVSPSGAARAAGTFRETLTYTDTAARDCTSNDQSWAATRTS